MKLLILSSLLLLPASQSFAEVFHCSGNTDNGPATARVEAKANKNWTNSIVILYTNSFFTQTTRGEYEGYYTSTTDSYEASGLLADIDSRMELKRPKDGKKGELTIFASGDRRVENGGGARLTCE